MRELLWHHEDLVECARLMGTKDPVLRCPGHPLETAMWAAEDRERRKAARRHRAPSLNNCVQDDKPAA